MNSGNVSVRMSLLCAVFCLLGAFQARAESPADKLDALPGFKIEHLLTADAKKTSWINLAKDNKGRLLLGAQRGQPVTRITIKDGQVEKQEELKLPISETMGMLYAFDSLYVVGGGKNKEGKSVVGLFRCRDTQGNGEYDSVEFLREWYGGGGEHGAHGIVLGPDKKLYMVAGNFVGLPKDLLPSSPHRNYADDRVLPRAEDGNGFGAGMKPPGGWIVRMDENGQNIEFFAAGQRNCYDIAFNADGELFGFDSDMEWDWGMPWYRPVRVFHSTSGADQGFREGTAKWPEYYFDSLPCSVTIGIGCPTGVVFGHGAKFPAKYQKAFYICDWTYGRLIAVHLQAKGAGYVGSWENFVAPKGLHGGQKSPLNLTDAVVGDDGAMYFTIGGRGTVPGLFRVTYTGGDPTVTADLHDKEGAEDRALRHKIEDLQGKEDPATVEAVWKHLSSADRYIRYAARIALERQPVEQWKSRALAEKTPLAALTSLLGLARLGKPETQPELFAALSKIAMSGLEEAQKLEKLRVIEVSIARNGKPAADAAKPVADELNAMYPASSVDLNRELCQTLIALEVPEAVAKTLELLAKATTQEEQISYVLFLRSAKAGWTPDLRKQYFSWWSNKERAKGHPDFVTQWFVDAGRPYGDGASFPKFLGNFFNDAKNTLSPDEQTSLADVLAAYTPPGKPPVKKPTVARKLVKEWAMADLLPALDEVGKGRSFERGKDVYEQAQCIACHKMGNAGGAVGADLTAIAARFQRRDILESIIEPSKVISEQFQNTVIKTKDGQIIEGRVIEENDAKIVLQKNQLLPDKTEVKKTDVQTRGASKNSPMPDALIYNFHKEEILDLLAYLEAGGNSKHPNFAAGAKTADVTARVAADVKGNKLSIVASNELFGDPAEGTPKKLKVEYTIGDAAQSKTVGEGETLEINAPEDKKLIIRRAIYGAIP